MINKLKREWYRLSNWTTILELIDMHHCEQFAREMRGKYAVLRDNGK